MKRKISLVLSLVALLVFVFAVRKGAVSGQSTAAASKEQVARGQFLVKIGGCTDCHTTKVMTAKGPVPDAAKFLAGAPADAKIPAVPPGVLTPTGWGALATGDLTTWAGPWGVSFASNLTPDKATGLGSWTEAAFIGSMRTGKHKGALREILPPMPWQALGELSDGDLKAIFAYLRSIKPIPNKVHDPLPPQR